jgi:pyruvate, orthophosphate dikinase
MPDATVTSVVDFAAAVGHGPELLGGKGAGLAAMHRRGLRVPPGFILTTQVCRDFLEAHTLPDAVRARVDAELAALEVARGRRLGDAAAPLLLAVRSGAAVSMPGMMDTVLNLGISDETVDALARECGTHFAYDCYARFLESFATVVLGVDAAHFAGSGDTDPQRTVQTRLRIIDQQYGPLPADPRVQLELAIAAVFGSWHNPRAAAYRRMEHIDDAIGTAVVVQSMVFGNRNQRSGTGVVFTRDPNTGAPKPYGDFLFEAQGEDVVSGNHVTLPVDALATRLPDVWAELKARLATLEAWRKDMLDVEFTIEDGVLYFLQVRTAKRSPVAAVRVAEAFAADGTITAAEAVGRITPDQADALARARRRSGAADGTHLAHGLAACPGLASGEICLSTDAVIECVDRGGDAILVRAETSPEDVQGMAMAAGILTTRGGLVSHAAVVARGLAVPAVVGATGVTIDESTGAVDFGTAVLRAGDVITVDGDGGTVDRGAVDAESDGVEELARLLAWADELVAAAGGVPDPERPAAARLAAAHDALEVRDGSAGLRARA